MENFYQNDTQSLLSFFAKISSSATHEINNVFSIINEYAGVIDDKLSLAAEGRPLDLNKVLIYKDKIYEQIQRGKTINKQLNIFSHSADNNSTHFELNATISNIMFLSDRLAKQNEIILSFIPQNEEIFLNGRQYEFERQFFSVIFFLIESLKSGSLIDIQLTGGNEKVLIINCPFCNELSISFIEFFNAGNFEEIELIELTPGSIIAIKLKINIK